MSFRRSSSMAFRFDLPDVEDAGALADWIEIQMLLSKKPQLSKAQLIDALVANLGSTPQELETPVNLLFAEIGRRRWIAGGAYPLAIDGGAIKFDSGSNFEFYKFLLLISLDGPMRRGRKFKDIDEMFDKLVCAALKAYLGEGSESLRFGWPVSDGRPKQFMAALEWLSTRIGLPVGSGVPASSTKDGGVDVVAWKPFADQRSAFLVAFAQCTVQMKWYPKRRDVIERVWFSRIDTGGWALTALAIPFNIPKNFENWDDLRRSVNLVFDRLRLAQTLVNSDSTQFASMIRWSNKEIARYAMTA